ncbi:unnamed protein product [Choristocarpus tenellus]
MKTFPGTQHQGTDLKCATPPGVPAPHCSTPCSGSKYRSCQEGEESDYDDYDEYCAAKPTPAKILGWTSPSNGQAKIAEALTHPSASKRLFTEDKTSMTLSQMVTCQPH